MPTYDYDCRACGATLEIFQSMSEAPKRKCPQCGQLKLSRRIGTGAGILFRGSGFYQTDYRTDSYKKAAEVDKQGSEGSTAPKESQDKTPDRKTPDPKTKDAKGAKGGDGSPRGPKSSGETKQKRD